MFLILWQVLQACAFVILTYFSLLSTHASRYLKSSTLFRSVPSIFLISNCWLLLYDIYFVLSVFMLSPIYFADSSTLLRISSASLIPSLNKVISSAKSNSVTILGGTLLLYLFHSWKPSFSSLPVRDVLMI